MTTSSQAKRLARLAAVQALYQQAIEPKAAAAIVSDFRANPTRVLHEDEASNDVDKDLFSIIVPGVEQNQTDIDAMISGAFDGKSDRLENLLRAILRAGVYELYHEAATPTAIIINDYVDIAHAFFDAKEPGLVNGVLDKLSKTLRA